ncbi:MAG: cyclic-di-AMP receptor [Chloroflexia bacterium]|nr:cyclic-di-AMP receptor [Chloroflexia bacterium]
MRLVIAIVQDYDANPYLRALAGAGFRATLLRTTGGFLRQGNTTVLVAVEDGDVAAVTRLCRDTCARRPAIPAWSDAATVDADPTDVVDVRIGGGVIFVVSLASFRQFEAGRERVAAGPVRPGGG